MRGEGGYEVSAPTATSDRVCARGTVRSGDQYQNRASSNTVDSQGDSRSLPCEVSKDKRQDANADVCSATGHGPDGRVEGAHGLLGPRVPDCEQLHQRRLGRDEDPDPDLRPRVLHPDGVQHGGVRVSRRNDHQGPV